MELERRTSLFPLSPSPESKRNAQTPTLIVACINAHPETVALQQEAIPDTAISESTNHIFLVKTQRESKVDSACFVEGSQLFAGEHELQTREIVLELRYLPRSNDRDYRHGSIAQPSECDLRHAATGQFGD